MNHQISPEPKGDQNQAKLGIQSDKTQFKQTLINTDEHFSPLEEKTTNLLLKPTELEELSNENTVDIEKNSEYDHIAQQSQKQLNIKIITTLASVLVMLPILAIGTTTYYFGNKAVDRQVALTRRIDKTGISKNELAKQRQLLANLLVGTGTTALMAGILTAFLTNRTVRNTIKRNIVIVKPKAEPELNNRNRSLVQFLDYLNQSFDREDIMIATVKEAQRLLKCDRVVIYQFQQNGHGKVIAEAVSPKWTKALGMMIQDSCFEADYKEKYRDGKVKILNNIDDINLDPCYVKQLEKLGIKANLVTPIIHQEKLFGLLAAHQCSDSRFWQPDEIELLTRLAQRVSFVLDNTKLLAESKLLKEQVETETDWTEYFTNFVKHIQESVQEQEILDVSVEEVRKVLDCDRVLIYSLNQDKHGTVIAESVLPGWTRANGITIKDPCFEARYIEKYQNGRVCALDNVYEADMMACYLEQLEKLEVKANLVTPIINQGKLFGLLVAHQCASPRSWKTQEIRWLTQIATQVGLALDRVQLSSNLLAESTRLTQQQEIETQWTEFLTDAVRHIRQSLQPKDILDVSVKEVRKVLDCDRVLIYSLNQDKHGTVIAESIAPGWTKALGVTIQDPCFEARYMEQYQSGRVRALNDIYEAKITACYLEQLEKLEVKANLVTPIINQGKLFGLLVAHQCANPRSWQKHEIRWLTQIATQVGFALDSARLVAESSQLQHKVARENQWTHFFGDVVKGIRKSLQKQDILEVSVEQVRRILICDRVVIYSLNYDNHGIVIAESVAPGWTRANGLTIQDPCFEARYIEKYQNGRVQAIDNVYQAGITACYLEQLKKLEVKANLVTPIIVQDRLFGLLVAHQCSNIRTWQQHEILWVTQIAIQVGFALDHATLLKRLKTKNLPPQPKLTSSQNSREITSDNVLAQKMNLEQQISVKTLALPTEPSKLLLHTKKGFETLKLKVTRQSEFISQFLLQIQTIANLAQEINTIEKSSMPYSGSINAQNNLMKIGEKITQSAQEITQINHYAKQLDQISNLIENLTKQIEQQETDVSTQTDQTDGLEQNSHSSLSMIVDRVKPLTSRLITQAKHIETLIQEISISAQEIVHLLDLNTDSTHLEINRKQNLILDFRNKVQAFISKTAQIIEQTQNLAVVNQFILQIATRANRKLAQ